MPRKKDGGRGSTPGNQSQRPDNIAPVSAPPDSTSPTSAVGQSQFDEESYRRAMLNANGKPCMNYDVEPRQRDGNENNRDQIFQYVQEMFQGKIEEDVIHMMLSESDWKVEDALEKLFLLTSEHDQGHPVSMKSIASLLERSSQPPSSTDMGYNLNQNLNYCEDITQSVLPTQQITGVHLPSTHDSGSFSINHGTGQSIPGGTHTRDRMSHHQQLNVNTGLRSRLPSQPSPGIPTPVDQLPVLSPKTPHIVQTDFSALMPSYPDDLASDSNSTVQSAMQALDSYAGAGPFQSSLNHPVDLYSDFSGNEIPDLYSGGIGSVMESVTGGPSSMDGNSLQLPPHYSLSSGVDTHVELCENTGGSLSPGHRLPSPSASQPSESVLNSSVECGDSQTKQELLGSDINAEAGTEELRFNPGSKVPIPPKPKGTRKKTLSLNPEEREALENLIEDVIIGGVGEGLIDSDSSEESENGMKGKHSEGQKAAGDASKGNQTMPKIYPAQLKVAVKHMKQLPPRFVRRLQNAQKKIEAAERLEAEKKGPEETLKDLSPVSPIPTLIAEPEQSPTSIFPQWRDKDRPRSKEVQRKETKKKIRNLLEDLDQYTDEANIPAKAGENGGTSMMEAIKEEDGAITAVSPELTRESRPIHVGMAKPGRPGQDVPAILQRPSAVSQAGGASVPTVAGNDTSRSMLPFPPVSQAAGIPLQISAASSTVMPMMVEGAPVVMRTSPLNCADLERELLASTSSSTPANLASTGNFNSAMYSGEPLMAHTADAHRHLDPYFQHAFQLSAEAPEFVPGQGRPFPAGMVDPAILAGSLASQSVSPGDLLQVQAQLPYQPGGQGRVSPHVSDGSPAGQSQAPIPPIPLPDHRTPPSATTASLAVLNPAGRSHSPAFLIPKLDAASPAQTTPTPPPPPRSHHPGVGILPMTAAAYGGVPYTAYPPPPPPPVPPYPGNFPVRPPFFQNTNYAAALASPGLPPTHPLVGRPLTQSPQMGRKNRSGLPPTAVPPPPFPLPFAAHIPHPPPYVIGALPRASPAPETGTVMSTCTAVRRVRQLLAEGKKVMVLLRGCPGSGKTTIAKEIQFSGVILSSDDFFMKNGSYEYDGNKLGEAHEWNQKRAKEAVENGKNPIIIDNTNSQSWEMKNYTTVANKNSYFVEIIEPDTPWRLNAKELAKRNGHGVGVEAIRRMLERYEHGVGIQSIMGTSNNCREEAERQRRAQLAQQQRQQQQQQQQQQAEPGASGGKRKRKKKRRKRRRRRDRHGSGKAKSEDTENASSGESSNEEDETLSISSAAERTAGSISAASSVAGDILEQTTLELDVAEGDGEQLSTNLGDPEQGVFAVTSDDVSKPDNPDTVQDQEESSVSDSQTETESVAAGRDPELLSGSAGHSKDPEEALSRTPTAGEIIRSQPDCTPVSGDSTDRINVADSKTWVTTTNGNEDKHIHTDQESSSITSDSKDKATGAHRDEDDFEDDLNPDEVLGVQKDQDGVIGGSDSHEEVPEVLTVGAYSKFELLDIKGNAESTKDENADSSGRSAEYNTCTADVPRDSDPNEATPHSSDNGRPSCEGSDNIIVEEPTGTNQDLTDTQSDKLGASTLGTGRGDTADVTRVDKSTLGTENATAVPASCATTQDIESPSPCSPSGMEEDCVAKPSLDLVIPDDSVSSQASAASGHGLLMIRGSSSGSVESQGLALEVASLSDGEDVCDADIDDDDDNIVSDDSESLTDVSHVSESSDSETEMETVPNADIVDGAQVSQDIDVTKVLESRPLDTLDHSTGFVTTDIGVTQGSMSASQRLDTENNNQVTVDTTLLQNFDIPSAVTDLESLKSSMAEILEEEILGSLEQSELRKLVNAGLVQEKEPRSGGTQTTTAAAGTQSQEPVPEKLSKAIQKDDPGAKVPDSTMMSPDSPDSADPSALVSSDIEVTYWSSRSPSHSDTYCVTGTDDQRSQSSSRASVTSAVSGQQLSEDGGMAASQPAPPRQRRKRRRDVTDQDGDSSLHGTWTDPEAVPNTIPTVPMPPVPQHSQAGTDLDQGAQPRPVPALTLAETPITPTKPSEDHRVSSLWSPGSDSEEGGGWKFPNNEDKKQQSALLDTGVRRKLLSTNWEIPAMVNHSTLSLTPPARPHSDDTGDTATMTSPRDFALTHKVNHSRAGKVLPTDLGKITVRRAIPRNLSFSSGNTGSDNITPSHPYTFHIDKSTATDDLPAKVGEGLDFLVNCFPGVTRQDLDDVVQQCGGDLEWAVNILLDSGYEYNEPVNRQPSAQTEEPTEPAEPVTPAKLTVNLPSPSVATLPGSSPGLKSPESLFMLSHDVLSQRSVDRSRVVEQMAEQSFQRLQSIEEFQKDHVNQAEEDSPDLSRTPECNVVSSEHQSPKAAPVTQSSGTGSDSLPPSVDDNDNKEGITLKLSDELAHQLLHMFGPVGFHISPESLSAEDMSVKLSRSCARHIHQLWSQSIQERFAEEEVAIHQMMEKDEALARLLQEEEYKLRSTAIPRGDLVVHVGDRANETPPPLREIMQEQQALETSKQEYLDSQTEVAAQAQCLSTRIKWQKLLQMFPKVDQHVLQDVYRTSGYSLDVTVETVQRSLGREPTPPQLPPDREREEEELRQALELSLKDQCVDIPEQLRNGADIQDSYQTLEDPNYQDYRAEASMHYKLRHECFQKAQEAYRRGMKGAAAFYSQQGHLHTQKLREANKRAAGNITERKNQHLNLTNSLDLHGLHVDEALEVLQGLLQGREEELRKHFDKRKCYLYVVTGRGTHSRGGVAKIRPAVIDYLNKHKYRFTEDSPSILKVFVSPAQ